MKTAPSSAATNASGRKCPAPSASEVPTSTGATAAGSVRGRAAISQMCTALDAFGVGAAAGAGAPIVPIVVTIASLSCRHSLSL